MNELSARAEKGEATAEGVRVRHALFVAFHFPPEASSSGVLRTLKYTRYLGAHGWRLTVLTLDRKAYDTKDVGLENQIPADVRVVRTPFLDVKRHLAIRGVYPAVAAVPDRWIGWWPWAVRAGRRVIRSQPVDLVYSTSPHATAHLVALSLARRAELPWVADFRDPWYEEPPEPGTARVAHWAGRYLESAVVRRADRVVASTERLRDVLACRYPQEPSRKFVAIPNGYDEDDFAVVPRIGKGSRSELLILHAGPLNPTFRDPRPLFTALREAADAGALDPSRVRLRFLGAGPFGDSAEVSRAIQASGLVGRVEFLPRVEYNRALVELLSAEVLLLLQASPDTKDLVPAKVFEYLRAGRPVLAVVKPGATTEILRQVGGGWSVDPQARGELRDALIAAYRAWSAGRLDAMAADPGIVKRFTRERLAADLAVQFESVLRR